MEMSESLTERLLEDYPSNDEIEKSEQSEQAIAIPIKSNHIILKLNIQFFNVNYNKIYFLDNYEHYLERHPHQHLKELNKKNTKLYINEKEYKYEKYFVPSKAGIYTIRLDFNILMKDCSYMFLNCEYITSIDLSSFNTSEVINMSHMFSNCRSLTSINFGLFNTTNVRDMSNMFSDCNYLNSLDLSSFNTKNVNSMSFMFYNCSQLNSIDLSSFDTKNVNSMSFMFYNCSQLNSIDLSSFDTKNQLIYHLLILKM